MTSTESLTLVVFTVVLLSVKISDRPCPGFQGATSFDAFEAQINSQTENLVRRYGPATGYEFLRQEVLGTRLVRYQYLVFHEKAPLRWVFIFYKAEKGWAMTDFKFDGNTNSFFPGGV
jgi:hypothetical protein